MTRTQAAVLPLSVSAHAAGVAGLLALSIIPAQLPAARLAPVPPPVPVGGRIREPRKLRHVAPVYPKIARAARVQGLVVIECTLTPQGRVANVRVLRGHPLLDGAAADAVTQWVFTPTLLNGVPVPVIMTVTVTFELR